MTQQARQALDEYARDPLADGEPLRQLLAQNDDVIVGLCDPAFLDKAMSIEVARRIAGIEPNLDTRLAKVIPGREQHELNPSEVAVSERALELLEAVSPNFRSVHLIARLTNVHNARLRAKVTLMIGRQIRSARAAEERLQSDDPRVRANMVESMWGEKAHWASAILWKAVKDENNRVVGNALVGLHLLGDEGAIPYIVKMAEDARSSFRATAAWTMGQTGDPQFLAALQPLTHDLYASVRKNAAKAIERIGPTHRGG